MLGKKSNQPFYLLIVPIGYRAAHYDIFLPAIPAQQHLESGLNRLPEEIRPMPFGPELCLPARVVDEDQVILGKIDLRLYEPISLDPEIGR